MAIIRNSLMLAFCSYIGCYKYSRILICNKMHCIIKGLLVKWDARQQKHTWLCTHVSPLSTCVTTHCIYCRHVSLTHCIYGRHVCPPLYTLDHSLCLLETCLSWSLYVWVTTHCVDGNMPVRLYTCMITRCIYSRHVSLDPSMYEWPLTVLMEDLYVPPLYMHGHSLCLW